MTDSDSVEHCSRLSIILNYIRILKKTKKIYRFWMMVMKTNMFNVLEVEEPNRSLSI